MYYCLYKYTLKLLNITHLCFHDRKSISVICIYYAEKDTLNEKDYVMRLCTIYIK